LQVLAPLRIKRTWPKIALINNQDSRYWHDANTLESKFGKSNIMIAITATKDLSSGAMATALIAAVFNSEVDRHTFTAIELSSKVVYEGMKQVAYS